MVPLSFLYPLYMLCFLKRAFLLIVCSPDRLPGETRGTLWMMPGILARGVYRWFRDWTESADG